MSLYGMVFGDRSAAAGVLLGPIDFGRYRDCWFEADDGDSVILAVYTRNGGGNRRDYADQIDAMRSHELYIEDADDSFDSTYATFRFRVPRSVLAAQFNADDVERVMTQASPRRDTDAMWQNAINLIGGRA